MAIVYRTDGAWGTGLGSDLSAAQIDGNFWDHEQRIATLESNPPVAVSISDITSNGTSLTISMSDGSTYGPFTMPTAEFHDTGVILNSTTYYPLDLVSVPSVGIFLVEYQITTPAAPLNPFDRAAVDATSGNPVYKQIFGVAGGANYDISFSVIGVIPADGNPLREFMVTRALKIPASLTGSVIYLGTATAVETLVFPIYQLTSAGASTQIGTATFTAGTGVDASGGQTATIDFAADVNFAITDRLVIDAPTVQDASAKDLVMTIQATRTDVV